MPAVQRRFVGMAHQTERGVKQSKIFQRDRRSQDIFPDWLAWVTSTVGVTGGRTG